MCLKSAFILVGSTVYPCNTYELWTELHKVKYNFHLKIAFFKVNFKCIPKMKNIKIHITQTEII